MNKKMLQTWGREDAENEKNCLPEYYTMVNSEIAAYVAGYREVKPDHLTGYGWLDALVVAADTATEFDAEYDAWQNEPGYDDAQPYC